MLLHHRHHRHPHLLRHALIMAANPFNVVHAMTRSCACPTHSKRMLNSLLRMHLHLRLRRHHRRC
jgi:hypothetical protein